MTDTPIQPDNIQLAPGEQSQPMNYLRFRYVCGCRTGKPHVAYRYFDQAPPNHCPGNTQMIRDSKWIDPDYTPPPQSQQRSGQTLYNWDMKLQDHKQLEEPR